MQRTSPVSFGSSIAVVDPCTEPSWDQALRQFSEASFFHSTAWASVLARTYGYTPRYLCRGDTASPAALLPLFEIRSPLTGHRGVSLPFTDECGPLGQIASDRQALVSHALELGRKAGWRTLELRGGTDLIAGAIPSTSYWNHQRVLGSSEKELFDTLAPACRRAIRKAEQSGLEVQFSVQLDDWLSFVRLLETTRQRLGVPPQPRRFFQEIHHQALAQNLGRVVLVRHRGQPVAGALFLHFGNQALFKFGASDQRFQHLRANNLVFWAALQWHQRNGFKKIDFGRTSLGNEGLRTFKLSWGTQETRLDYMKYDFRSQCCITSPDRGQGWHSGVFKRMPLSLSRAVGRFLYRHIG